MLLFKYRGQDLIGAPLDFSRQPFLSSHILPSSVEKIRPGIRLPTAYLILVAAFIRISGHVVNIENLPNLKIKLWYQGY